MPYDPRMLQMARAGIGMMAPPPSPFERAAQQQPQRPKEWWEQPLPVGKSRGAQSPQDDPSNPDDPNAPKKQPPSLLDMMMGLGRMTPQQYNQRIHGAPPDQQQGNAMVSPWAWLGSLGGGRP